MPQSLLTFSDIVTRVRRLEGHQHDDDTDMIEEIGLEVNEAYFEMITSRDWYWTRDEQSISHTGGGELILPTAIYAVRYIRDAGNRRLEPRYRSRQEQYADYYANKGLRTYALDGHDVSTGGIVLNFEPEESATTFTVGCNVLPSELSADSDRPLGPPNMGAYLVWYTRWLRLMGDEERPTLISQSQARWERLHRSLVHDNMRLLKGQVMDATPAP